MRVVDRSDEREGAIRDIRFCVGDPTGTPWEAQADEVLEELAPDEELGMVFGFLSDPDGIPGLIAQTNQRVIGLGDRPFIAIRLADLLKMRFVWTSWLDKLSRLRLTTVDGRTAIWDMRGDVVGVDHAIFGALTEACPDLPDERLATLDPEAT